MKLNQAISEDAMIATFLAGEITSKRFGNKVHEAIKKLGAVEQVVSHPNLQNEHDNRLRRELLLEARGYGSNTSWFAGWPEDVAWYTATVDREELAGVKYIVYSYWLELTHGTLRAGDAVATIQRGDKIYDVDNKPFWDASKAIERGTKLPPMILVGTAVNDLVVMEGHLRLTAYLLAGDKAPCNLDVLVGLSPNFVDWKMYSFASYDKHR